MPSFSVVGSNTGTDTSIEISALSIASGDLCLLWNVADGGGSNPADVTPPDFNVLRTLNSNNRRAKIFYKILTGSETSVTGLNGNNSERWIVLVLRPDATITAVTDNDTSNNQATTGNPTSQTITASGESAPVVLYGHMYASGTVSPRSTSPAMTELTSGATHYSHYYLYNSGDTPADHTYDMDDEGTNFISSGYLTFAFINAYTLDVGAGSFSLSGQAVSLKQGYVATAGTGSFSLSGQAVSLEHGRNLAVGAGSYSLTGQDVTLTYTPADNPTLAAEHGTYALTGQAVSLEVGRNLAAEHGSYTLTGQAVSFLRDLVLAAESGTYTLSGQDAALLIGHLLTAEHGTYTLSGQDVTLAKGRTLAAEFGSYALTGQAVGLFRGYPLAAEFGSYVLSGQDVDLSRTFSGLTAEYGSYVLTGQPVNLEHGRALAAEYGVYTLTGQDIAFLRGLGLSAEYGSFILSGQSVILGNIFKLGVGCGTFALTGQDVSLIYLPNVIGTVADLDEITTSPTALTNITTTRSIGNSITSSPDFRVIN